MERNRLVTFGLPLILAAGVVSFFVYRDITESPISTPPVVLPPPSPATTTAPHAPPPSLLPAAGGEVDIGLESPFANWDGRGAPNLDLPFVIPASFPPDVQAKIRTRAAETAANLRENPHQLAAWLDLAIYRKMVNDYRGAEEIWLFLVKATPKDSSAYQNLGDLYGYFLKDTHKAEFYYQKALALDPANIAYYRAVSMFYKDVLGDAIRARSILVDGIEKNPNSSKDLKNLLDLHDAQ